MTKEDEREIGRDELREIVEENGWNWMAESAFLKQIGNGSVELRLIEMPGNLGNLSGDESYKVEISGLSGILREDFDDEEEAFKRIAEYIEGELPREFKEEAQGNTGDWVKPPGES